MVIFITSAFLVGLLWAFNCDYILFTYLSTGLLSLALVSSRPFFMLRITVELAFKSASQIPSLSCQHSVWPMPVNQAERQDCRYKSFRDLTTVW